MDSCGAVLHNNSTSSTSRHHGAVTAVRHICLSSFLAGRGATYQTNSILPALMQVSCRKERQAGANTSTKQPAKTYKVSAATKTLDLRLLTQPAPHTVSAHLAMQHVQANYRAITLQTATQTMVGEPLVTSFSRSH
jgi:hypothetical protein